ncbi:hypothetical protein ScPMuIL_001659 [Solemya velum]
MASKRGLYKPAPRDKVGLKKTRKPLAQGRLVTQSSGPTTVSEVLSQEENGKRQTQKRPTHVQPGVVQTHVQTHRQTPTVGEDGALTPRRMAPNVTLQQSPKLSKPVKMLDLSDTDLDISQQSAVDHVARQKVIFVDASRQTKGPDQSEVDIVLGVEKSPIKVICHSPGALTGSFRESGDVANALRVDVSSVPSIVVENDHKDLPIGRLRFEESDGISDSDACSLNEYVTPKASKSQISSSSTKAPRTETPRKKKVKIIPSRYMQAAVAKSKPEPKSGVSFHSTSTRLKSADLTRSGRASRSMDQTRKSSHKKSHVLEARVPETREVEKKSEVHTPDSSQMSTGGKTSTPTSDGYLFHDIDASAIHPDVSILSTGDISRTTAPSSTTKNRNRGASQSLLSDTILQGSTKKRKSAKITQSDLDMLYARYLQWVYLTASAEKNLHSQEASAMAQISALHEEVDDLYSRKAGLEQELAQITHQNLLEKQLDVQRQGLGPVVSNLPTLSQEYRSLANALDTTRHQIPTKGIHLPDDEDQFQVTLEKTLAESEHLLGELSVMIRQEVPNVSSMATALNMVEKSVEEQCQELSRCRELISATQSLVTQETTLKIQALHSVSG